MNYQLAINIASDLIKKEEGIPRLPDGRVKAYWDKAGEIWTIGWGNTYYQDGRPVKEGDVITYQQAVDLMKFVVAQKEKAIRPYVTAKLNENQYAALIDLAYNWGEGNLRKSKLLQLINAGAPEAEILDQWDETAVTAKGTYYANLYKRRLNEFKLYSQKVMEVVRANPEISLATILTAAAVTGYYIYRFVKHKK